MGEQQSDDQNAPEIEGFFFDEVSRIRVLDTTKHQETVELRDEAKDFTERIEQFHGTAGDLIEMVTNLAKLVEEEKLNALGTRNLVNSVSQQRDRDKQQLLEQTAEKQIKIERLRVEYSTLLKIQQEQEQMMESFATS
eukprot:m.56909 g.56909  ORF g.56909 m.56909 type:complete len:138 (-) comp11067_c0_seq3:1159-1572(-)